MATTIQAKLTNIAEFLPQVADSAGYRQVFEANRHRIYALAFWMTDNEASAEQLMHNTFCRAFAFSAEPSAEVIDRALVSELREEFPLGPLILAEPVCETILGVRRNTLRIHLERAIVQVPRTERMIFLLHDVEGYDHSRIARTLGVTEGESQSGLHQARICMRRLLASMTRRLNAA